MGLLDVGFRRFYTMGLLSIRPLWICAMNICIYNRRCFVLRMFDISYLHCNPKIQGGWD